jgi:pSer/pThr/pTyr-binding forkhead associated (FHA) protein
VWLWYILIPAALLISLLLVLLLTLRARRGEPAAAPPGEPPISLRTLAFLEPHDGSGERYAVTSAAYRIGRHSDNDLTIQDPSVSRQHAEIHRKRDGSFTITDLGSVNGVFVNQKKIESATLADGDIVEIGDRAYRFNVQVNEDLGGEDTVVLKTMNPVSPLPEVRAGGS